MKRNMGQTDRNIRIVLGVILVLVLVLVQSGWSWVGLLGIVLLATAFMNFCPLYTLFGIRTNKAEDKDNVK